MENLTEQEKKLLDYYYEKQKKKKIIVISIIIAILVGLIGYVVININNQAKWEVKEQNIVVEYGTPYQVNLGALVDTSKYPFITYDSTSISSNMKNEENKDYAPVGNYQIIIKYFGNIKIFGIPKKVENQKTINLQIKDTTNPKIIAPEKIEILVGTKFDIKSYLYLFNVEDFSKADDITFDTSNINTNKVGDYKLKAKVEDAYSNSAECEVMVVVINDPYEEEPTSESEPISKKETSTSPHTKPAEKETKKQSTTKQEVTYKNKDFLFSDGYTMSTVSDAAYEYLKKTGKSGECVPLKNNEGLYIGMRVIIYN